MKQTDEKIKRDKNVEKYGYSDSIQAKMKMTRRHTPDREGVKNRAVIGWTRRRCVL